MPWHSRCDRASTATVQWRFCHPVGLWRSGLPGNIISGGNRWRMSLCETAAISLDKCVGLKAAICPTWPQQYRIYFPGASESLQLPHLIFQAPGRRFDQYVKVLRSLLKCWVRGTMHNSSFHWPFNSHIHFKDSLKQRQLCFMQAWMLEKHWWLARFWKCFAIASSEGWENGTGPRSPSWLGA